MLGFTVIGSRLITNSIGSKQGSEIKQKKKKINKIEKLVRSHTTHPDLLVYGPARLSGLTKQNKTYKQKPKKGQQETV